MPSLSRPRYRLYIDESGDHTYQKVEEFPHRYLALLGVWFQQGDDYNAFASDLERFKLSLFGQRPDNPVVLHRSDIINRKSTFGILCDEEKRNRFDMGLLEVVSRARFKIICVVLNKQEHKGRYVDPFHPYHYCLAAMLERFSGWLNYKNAMGDVMAESRGKEEDLQLKQAYRRVYESGTKGAFSDKLIFYGTSGDRRLGEDVSHRETARCRGGRGPSLRSYVLASERVGVGDRRVGLRPLRPDQGRNQNRGGECSALTRHVQGPLSKTLSAGNAENRG